MSADFSRIRHDPLLDWAGVELKQGGVLLDADANELVAVIDRRARALASDVLGRATVSQTTPDAFQLTLAGGMLRIGRGRLYVDGLLAECHGAGSAEWDTLLAETRGADPVRWDQQPYLPAPPALPTAGRHLVYLDVWQREVTHLEAPGLVEIAVGVETSSRVQTVWQVRVLAEDAGNAACASADAAIPGWAALIAPGDGRLSTGTFEVPPIDDPCRLPPTGGYRGVENHLYRVEIHDAGTAGGGATFKWSRENASVGARVSSVVSATELELDTLGRDDVLGFKDGDWVEIVDDRREFSQLPGEMRRIGVDVANRRVSFTPALPAAMLPAAFPDSVFPGQRNLRVKRWDQRGRVLRTGPGGTTVQVQDLDAPGSSGVIAVPGAATTLLLEDGVTVNFQSGARGFKAGDWWVFAARTADASVEILQAAAPRGIHHHYARLGLWDVAAGTITDCRVHWPPAAGGSDCGCTECVTPESHASGALTIQAAVDLERAIDGDHEPRVAAPLDPGRNERHVQPQRQTCGHHRGDGRDAEERHLDAAVVALVHEQADATAGAQLAHHAARCLADLEKAAAEGGAPIGHQMLERGIALAPVDHGERNAGTCRRDREQVPIREVRGDEDARPTARTDVSQSPQIDHVNAILAGIADLAQARILHQGAAERTPDPRCGRLDLLARPVRKGHAEIEQHMLILA